MITLTIPKILKKRSSKRALPLIKIIQCCKIGILY